jgi:hypothetical protein
MNCRRMKKTIPLVSGDGLSAKKGQRIRAHLDRCPGCGQEAREFEAALKAAKNLAAADLPEDWSDAEWRKMMAAIASEKVGRRKVFVAIPSKPVLAGGLALVLVAAGTFFLLKKPANEPGRPRSPSALASPSQVRPEEPSSVTIVSKETGLKIMWFFNKDLDLEKFGK